LINYFKSYSSLGDDRFFVSTCILICKSSARTKQSVNSVALKTPLEIRLGIFIYKTSLLHQPDDYIGFTPSCPPTFCNKIAPMHQNSHIR